MTSLLKFKTTFLEKKVLGQECFGGKVSLSVLPEAAAVVGFLLVVHLLRQLAARRDEVNVLRHARQQLARHTCQPHSSPDHLVKLRK